MLMSVAVLVFCVSWFAWMFLVTPAKEHVSKPIAHTLSHGETASVGLWGVLRLWSAATRSALNGMLCSTWAASRQAAAGASVRAASTSLATGLCDCVAADERAEVEATIRAQAAAKYEQELAAALGEADRQYQVSGRLLAHARPPPRRGNGSQCHPS